MDLLKILHTLAEHSTLNPAEKRDLHDAIDVAETVAETVAEATAPEGA